MRLRVLKRDIGVHEGYIGVILWLYRENRK